MNRRSFLSALGLGAVALTDPERLLWTPGRKLISIPKAPAIYERFVIDGEFGVGDLITFAGRYVMNPVTGESTHCLQLFQVTGYSESGPQLTPVRLFSKIPLTAIPDKA